MGTFSIYRRGIDAQSMRQEMRRAVCVDTAQPGEPSSIAGRVNILIDQRQRCSNQDDIDNHDTAIKHLEQLATSAFKDRLLSGDISALGYRQRKDTKPTPIWPKEWALCVTKEDL